MTFQKNRAPKKLKSYFCFALCSSSILLPACGKYIHYETLPKPKVSPMPNNRSDSEQDAHKKPAAKSTAGADAVASPTPTATVQTTPEPVATALPTAAPTATATPVPTAVPTATAAPKPTAMPPPKPTAMPSPSPSPSPSPTPKPTASPSPSPSPSPMPTAMPTPAKPDDLCSIKDAKKRVFVLDLKSGWFAGDGGNFFKTIIDQKCGTTVEIVYAHITQAIIEGNIGLMPDAKTLLPCVTPGSTNQAATADCRMGDLSSIDQVWVLSGSEADPSDLPVSEDFFKSIVNSLKELRKTKPLTGFFFGAGIGNVDHVNRIADQLFPILSKPELFTFNTTAPRGAMPNPIFSQLFSSSYLTGSISGFPAGIKDFDKESHYYLAQKTELGECLTDPIGSAPVQELAFDRCGNLAVARATVDGAHIHIEGNTTRFYLHTATEYFNRTVAWLFN